ncbi:MAG: metallophosphoesterase family protein [Verrucomicrobiae bacterium]
MTDRIAFLSDIHGCEEALGRVLASIAAQGISRMISLGDVLGYGPSPAECVRLLRQSAEVCLIGNHDAMAVTDGFDLSMMSAPVAIPLELARRELDAEQKRWLESLPLTWNGDGIQASHASLHEPSLFTHIENSQHVRRHFSRQTAGISFYGHTHVPVVYCLDDRGRLGMASGNGEVLLSKPGRYAVGVGSVGFARDGDPRACWVEFRPNTPSVIFHRVDFDFDALELKVANMLETAETERNAE